MKQDLVKQKNHQQMNSIYYPKKRFLIIGTLSIIALMAFMFVGKNAKTSQGPEIQNAGFFSTETSNDNLPCVAGELDDTFTSLDSYKSLKWSKASKSTNIAGADSVIVHGYRMRNEDGTFRIYTKLIYFNTQCEVIRVE